MNNNQSSADGKPYLPPVSPDELKAYADQGKLDPAWMQQRQQELHYVHNWRRQRGDKVDGDYSDPEQVKGLVGLALSGGGIRSAIFSLGVMQALAAKDLMKKVDYLSTVSGGGYIGSSLSWLCSDRAQQPSVCKEPAAQAGNSKKNALPRPGVDEANFPYGSDDPAPACTPKAKLWQNKLLQYLRRHGYYLTPGNGITALSLLVVVLRGVFLNLMVWIPAFVLFFVFGLWGAQSLDQSTGMNWLSGVGIEQSDAAAPLILPAALQAIRPASECPAGLTYKEKKSLRCDNSEVQQAFDVVDRRLPELQGFEFFLRLSAGLFALLLLSPMIYSVGTWFRRDVGPQTACAWYSARRWYEKTTAFVIPIAIATLVIGSLPLVAVYLHSWTLALGPLALIGGIVMTLSHFFRTAMSGNSLPVGPLVTIGAALFLYGTMLTAYEIAFLGFSGDWPWSAVAVLAGLIVVLGWFVNLNHISIHRYYRDRLMESFMPDIDAALQNRTGAAHGADSTFLQDLFNRDQPSTPFHIVNTNLILVNSEDPTYAQRGGDNFTLTPCYCGSNATGWRCTAEYMGGRMTLATAMAISGAAVNPNSGVGGEGLTRNRALSLVMSLLNLRLGFWASNPDPDKQSRHAANHLSPGGYSFGNALGCSSLGFSEQRAFLNISDGGQFENTGIYELVRRRVAVIIACDGGGDLGFTFSDFQTTVRRIEADFGARVEVHKDASPNQMVPMVSDQATYPKGAGFASKGYMICTIHYCDGGTATLLYLKTTLIEQASFRVKGYAAQNRDFPDQSTADQFFDEVQFEAYRELGYRIATEMLEDKVLKDLAGDLPADSDYRLLIEHAAGGRSRR